MSNNNKNYAYLYRKDIFGEVVEYHIYTNLEAAQLMLKADAEAYFGEPWGEIAGKRDINGVLLTSNYVADCDMTSFFEIIKLPLEEQPDLYRPKIDLVTSALKNMCFDEVKIVWNMYCKETGDPRIIRRIGEFNKQMKDKSSGDIAEMASKGHFDPKNQYYLTFDNEIHTFDPDDFMRQFVYNSPLWKYEKPFPLTRVAEYCVVNNTGLGSGQIEDILNYRG